MRALAPLLITLTGCVASNYGEPHYLYFDGDFGPVASPLGMVYGTLTVDGVSSIAASTLWAGDPIGVTDSGDSLLPPVLGPDGYVVDASGGELRVYTDRLSPWSFLPLAGDASRAVPAVDAEGTSYVGDSNGFAHAFDFHGDALWSSDLGGSFGIGRRSLDGEGRLLMLRDNAGEGPSPGYVAVDVATGEVLWEVDAAHPWSPLHPHDGRAYGVQYLGDPSPNVDRDLDQYRLFARSLEDGSLLWEQNLGMFPLAPSVYAGGDLVVVMNTLDASSAAVARLTPDGDEVWRVNDETFYGRPTILNNGHILLGCGGELCELNSDGSVFRTFDMDGFSAAYAPLVQDGVVVANSAGVYAGWDTRSTLRTATDGWPRYGGGNHGAGRVP